MSSKRFLVTITDNDGETYDQFVITDADALIELMGFTPVGVIPDGTMDEVQA